MLNVDYLAKEVTVETNIKLEERLHHQDRYFRERVYLAQQEIQWQIKPYIDQLFMIGMYKPKRFLFDPVKNTITPIESPKTDYEIWLEARIEDVKKNICRLYNIDSL